MAVNNEPFKCRINNPLLVPLSSSSSSDEWCCLFIWFRFLFGMKKKAQNPVETFTFPQNEVELLKCPSVYNSFLHGKLEKQMILERILNLQSNTFTFNHHSFPTIFYSILFYPIYLSRRKELHWSYPGENYTRLYYVTIQMTFVPLLKKNITPKPIKTGHVPFF